VGVDGAASLNDTASDPVDELGTDVGWELLDVRLGRQVEGVLVCGEGHIEPVSRHGRLPLLTATAASCIVWFADFAHSTK